MRRGIVAGLPRGALPVLNEDECPWAQTRTPSAPPDNYPDARLTAAAAAAQDHAQQVAFLLMHQQAQQVLEQPDEGADLLRADERRRAGRRERRQPRRQPGLNTEPTDLFFLINLIIMIFCCFLHTNKLRACTHRSLKPRAREHACAAARNQPRAGPQNLASSHHFLTASCALVNKAGAQGSKTVLENTTTRATSSSAGNGLNPPSGQLEISLEISIDINKVTPEFETSRKDIEITLDMFFDVATSLLPEIA